MNCVHCFKYYVDIYYIFIYLNLPLLPVIVVDTPFVLQFFIDLLVYPLLLINDVFDFI
jgi:hypothetical protein